MTTPASDYCGYCQQLVSRERPGTMVDGRLYHLRCPHFSEADRLQRSITNARPIYEPPPLPWRARPVYWTPPLWVPVAFLIAILVFTALVILGPRP